MPESTEERKGRLTRARERMVAAEHRGQEWVAHQDPASRPGVAIGAWQRYQAVDGPLQSLLLTVYAVIAVLPALLVMEEFLDSNPATLTHHLVHHYGFSGTTAGVLRSVLVQTRSHEVASALLAIAGALFFGLGFGRVLQLVHVRAWRLSLPRHMADQARYALVLVALYGMILLLLVQNTELAGRPSWAASALAPGWVVLLVVYFVWAPRLLTHKRIPRRDFLPAAVLTAIGLVGLLLVSGTVMGTWVDFYASDYGGFGVMMALFFWTGFSSTIIVAAASLSPALAVRRERRAAPTTEPSDPATGRSSSAPARRGSCAPPETPSSRRTARERTPEQP